MKYSHKQTKGIAIMKRMNGMTLLEIVLAMVVFAVGMLALAHLQTNLTRSSSDANTRTVATNIAEEIMEQLRAYQRVQTDPAGILFAYADIDGTYADQTIQRGGVNFTVDGSVIGYNFDADRESVTAVDPAVAGTIYDFKVVRLAVSWDSSQQFLIDDATQISAADMDTGSITITDLIPSIPALASAKVAATDDGELGGPTVNYTPGLNPDIVAINLQNSKFKESTTPAPVLIHGDQLAETWFDVITYNNSNPNAIFLRREEFLTVTCECTLRDSVNGSGDGFLPTVWNGLEYAEGEWVSKPYGESANNQQSQYCSTCCRDHHDGATGKSGDDQVYDPQKTWVGGSNSADHEHYTRSNKGALTLAGAGDNYVEACRMVRKDGFLRVAQDFRQEGFFAFPEDYLDDSSEIDEYSDYVTDAVKDFYEQSRTALKQPGDMSPKYTIPASTEATATALPTAGLAASQQLRSRGVYIDNISAEARKIIDCMIGPPAKSGDDCDAGGVDNYLEILPFFELQTTFLSSWIENSNKDPVEVSSDVVDNKGYSRGLAKKTGTAAKDVTANTSMHRGNIGFTVTDPISPYDTSVAAATADIDLYIAANGGGGTPSPTGNTITATFISGVNGVNATDTVVTPASGTVCQRAGTSLSCTTDLGNLNGSITFSGYYKNASTDLWVCVANLTGASYSGVVYTGSPKSTTVTWPNSGNITGVAFSIENSGCPAL